MRPGLIFFAALAVSSCGGGGSSGSTSSPPVAVTPTPTPSPTPSPSAGPSSGERDILPAATDAAISNVFGAHVAIAPDPAVAARGRLFVMLPGTGAAPGAYRLILRTGSARGYHAIGLAYPNDRAIEYLCGVGTPASCSGDARLEVITGTDASAVVSVGPADSIDGRLKALLVWLQANYPGEGWNRFLRAGVPDWSLITIAGHSQGAGHAAYMAKLHAFDRVALFAGPGDVGAVAETPAPWLDLPPATTPERQYGFAHDADELLPFTFLHLNWARLGLASFGAPVSVDHALPPYGNSHELFTSLPAAAAPGLGAPLHSSIVLDAATPRAADGSPTFRDVWDYMAFPLPR